MSAIHSTWPCCGKLRLGNDQLALLTRVTRHTAPDRKVTVFAHALIAGWGEQELRTLEKTRSDAQRRIEMTSNDDRSGLFGVRPILCVENVARSIEYYVNCLGFRLGWAWSTELQRFLCPLEPVSPTFALVGLGQVQFMLSEKSQGVAGMWLHLDVHTAEQLDALHESWAAKGARILEPPSIRPWGMYEMRVQDLDEHMLRVSAPPKAARQDH